MSGRKVVTASIDASRDFIMCFELSRHRVVGFEGRFEVGHVVEHAAEVPDVNALVDEGVGGDFVEFRCSV